MEKETGTDRLATNGFPSDRLVAPLSPILPDNHIPNQPISACVFVIRSAT